jgi:hypothetical protein
MALSDEETVSGTNGTVENNIVFSRAFFQQRGSECVSRLEHEFVTVSPPLEDARLDAVGAVGNFAAGQLLKHAWDKIIQGVRGRKGVRTLFWVRPRRKANRKTVPDTFSSPIKRN